METSRFAMCGTILSELEKSDKHHIQGQRSWCFNIFWPLHNKKKTHNLFWVDENSIEQCSAAHIVQYCKQYRSALLSLS